MPRAKKTENLPINYAERMRAEADAIAKRIAAPSGDRIKMTSREFTTPDGTTGSVLDVVIVDFISANLWYEELYNPDDPQPPGCFAIGMEPSLLVPSPNSPNRQAESCAICPMNQFGTAITGRGKACKNTRQLALLPADAAELVDEEEPPIWLLSVPPTSLKYFDSYVQVLAAKRKVSPIGVQTQIYLDENSDYAAPRFKAVRPLNNKEVCFYMDRRDEAMKRLLTEPDVTQYQQNEQGRKKTNTRRRSA